MSVKNNVDRRSWYLLGGLAAVVLFSVALTANGAFAHMLGNGTARPTTPTAPHVVPFTPGNLVIYRVGAGETLTNTGNVVFLDEYTPLGTLVQSIPVPTVTSGANRRLIANGTSTSEGLLTRSINGQYMLFTGYDAALGGATSLSTTSSATVPRVIGRIDASGNIDTSTALTDASSAGNPRSAVSTNGTDLWETGSQGGIRYATLGATTSIQLSTTATNLRQANIFANQLYVSAQTGSIRLATVGTGTPITTGQTITNLPGFPIVGSPYGFYFADLDAGVAGLDTLYVADDGANAGAGANAISKYSLVGGSWTFNGAITASAVRGLTAVTAGTTVNLYATTGTTTGGGTLYGLTDATGYNTTITGTLTTLATAATNIAFRGVAIAPGVVVPPTSTPTNTPVPPTDTPTATPVPPTDTPTVTPTNTPQTLVVGHVTWQGRPSQPDPLQQLPITLTLKMGTTETNYTGLTTDASGNFTVSVGGLPDGTYNWRVKGPQFLANSGTLTLTAQTTTNAEMGLMKTGDCNNDNVVNIQDVGIMKQTLGKSVGDPGYDARADLDGNNTVNVVDYNLLKGNFGAGGAPPIRPAKP